MHRFLDEILSGARPDLDSCIEELGDVIEYLHRYRETPQDPVWHAEGDVYIHTGMVLEACHELLADRAAHLSDEQKLVLILGALLHDVAKPVTTKEAEKNGIKHIISPGHEIVGRSYLVPRLIELGLPYPILEKVLGLVGYHQKPKMLVIKNRDAGAWCNLARLADPELLYWLEVADIQGRECEDKQQQLEILDMYKLFAQEYGAWQQPPEIYSGWKSSIVNELSGYNSDTHDLVAANAIKDFEAASITMPEEALAKSYAYRDAYPQLVLVVGASGSGKSTWIENNLADHQVVSLDEFREELGTSRADHTNEGKVVHQAKNRLRELLRHKERIVWDATSLRKEFRQQVIRLGYDYNALVTLVVFYQDERSIRQGNAKRMDAVRENILRKQLERAQWPELDEAHRIMVLDAGGQCQAVYGRCDRSISLYGQTLPASK